MAHYEASAFYRPADKVYLRLIFRSAVLVLRCT